MALPAVLKRGSSFPEISSPLKRVRQEPSPKPIGVTLRKVFIEQIRDGLLKPDGTRCYKTVEGRIHSRVFVRIKEGDRIDFFYMSKRADNVVCQVIKKNVYKTFAEMLTQEGVSNCLPQLREDELLRAVKMYEAIPGYVEKSKKFGVVALQLQVVTELHS